MIEVRKPETYPFDENKFEKAHYEGLNYGKIDARECLVAWNIRHSSRETGLIMVDKLITDERSKNCWTLDYDMFGGAAYVMWRDQTDQWLKESCLILSNRLIRNYKLDPVKTHSEFMKIKQYASSFETEEFGAAQI